MSKSIRNPKKLLKSVQRRYDKVCDQLEGLNDEATELEAEIMWLQSLVKKRGEQHGR